VVKALDGLEGVRGATASNAEKKAVVTYDPGLVSFEDMKNALIKAGYVASLDGKRMQDTAKPSTVKGSEFNLDDLVCYCFTHTRKDIEQDYQKNGRSTIMAKIASEKKAGGCDCANTNPNGR
jgi:cation transport ATPase